MPFFYRTVLLITVLFSSDLFAKGYDEIGIPITDIYRGNGNQNYSLINTKNGIIYNSTNFGISGWDGEKWMHYYTPERSRVRSMSQWNDDKIYVGTTNDIGYFLADTQGSLQYTSLLDGWPLDRRQFGEIWSTAANSKGVLFAAVDKMYFWDGIKTHELSDGLSGVYKVFAYGDDFIYKKTNASYFNIVQIKPEIKIKKSSLLLPNGIKIRQVFFNQKNNLTVFTSKSGVYELIGGTLVKKIDEKAFPKGTDIYNAIQASDGYYYLPSLNQGLFIVSEELKLLRQYTEKHNLGVSAFSNALEDVQGNIWLSGLPSIVKMVPPHIYSTFNTEKNSKESSYITLFQNKPLVTGNNIHLLEKGENALAPSYFKAVSPGSDYILKAVKYKGHLVSIGDAGIYAQRIEGDRLVDFEHLVDLNLFGRSLALDPVSGILFATSYTGLHRIQLIDGHWQIDLIPGIKAELDDIEISNDGIIWIGTSSQTLYRVENAQYSDQKTKVQKFNGSDGLGPYSVTPFKLSFGMAFGTYNGLMDFEQNRTPQLKLMTDFPDLFHSEKKDVYRLYEDYQDRMWFRIGSHTGFIKTKSPDAGKVNEDVFKPLPNSSYNGFVMNESNFLWVSMNRGEIFRINIDLMAKLPKQGMLNIRKISNLDTQEELYGGLNTAKIERLDQQHNSIRINFASTENVIQRSKKYRHRLLGSDYEKWSQWSTENYKDFTLLRGNDYLFQVEAKDGWDRISATEMSFTVAPIWYLSRTAWVVYAFSLMVLLIITGWLTQRWRTAKLNQRNSELEQQVEERTADVQTKAQELVQQQVLKDRFFTNVSHEFRTPLTLTITPLLTWRNNNVNILFKCIIMSLWIILI